MLTFVHHYAELAVSALPVATISASIHCEHIVNRLRRSDHIKDALISLRWLRVPERIKVAVQTYWAYTEMPLST